MNWPVWIAFFIGAPIWGSLGMIVLALLMAGRAELPDFPEDEG